MGLEFFDKAKEIMEKLEETQGEHIHEAAGLISESIRNGVFCRHLAAAIPMQGPSRCAEGPED